MACSRGAALAGGSARGKDCEGGVGRTVNAQLYRRVDELEQTVEEMRKLMPQRESVQERASVALARAVQTSDIHALVELLRAADARGKVQVAGVL